jgi:hypothetical protein
MNNLMLFVLESKLLLLEFKIGLTPSPTTLGIDKEKEPHMGEYLLFHSKERQIIFEADY